MRTVVHDDGLGEIAAQQVEILDKHRADLHARRTVQSILDQLLLRVQVVQHLVGILLLLIVANVGRTSDAVKITTSKSFAASSRNCFAHGRTLTYTYSVTPVFSTGRSAPPFLTVTAWSYLSSGVQDACRRVSSRSRTSVISGQLLVFRPRSGWGRAVRRRYSGRKEASTLPVTRGTLQRVEAALDREPRVRQECS